MEQFNLPVTQIGRAVRVSSQAKIQSTRKQLEEVIEIVRSDIGRIIEREGRLQDLNARADEMQARAEQFSRKALQVRRNEWWRSVRMMMSVAAVFTLVVTGIIGTFPNVIEMKDMRM
ncbi:unnamed protein product [Gongylonema pulchrum]|uniref:V-SNARE coiled-coil homology domain-containing protein n=1 Tax=Gongylonema pulchrum TaxID=637853 RepID=A0A183CXU7_9BILA|nr:unnamed protein product [Gongylonema pulchrum]